MSSVPEILYRLSQNLVQPLFQLKRSWNLVQVVLKPCTTYVAPKPDVFLKCFTSGPETLYEGLPHPQNPLFISYLAFDWNGPYILYKSSQNIVKPLNWLGDPEIWYKLSQNIVLLFIDPFFCQIW